MSNSVHDFLYFIMLIFSIAILAVYIFGIYALACLGLIGLACVASALPFALGIILIIVINNL